MWVAVLGMGRMGHALAERLLSGGHTVTVWNRTQGKADDLLARGARQAATPAEAAASSELTLTSLAALLLLVAWNMSEVKHFLHTIRVAPKSDVAVLLTCYGSRLFSYRFT